MSREQDLHEQRINEQPPRLPDGVMQGVIEGLVFIGFRIVCNRFLSFVFGNECLSVDNLKCLHPYVMSHKRNLREQQINEQSPWLPDGVMQG